MVVSTGIEYVVALITFALLVITIRRLNFYHPCKIWMILQSIFYLGTFYITDFDRPIEVKHFYLYSIFALSASISTLFIRKTRVTLPIIVSSRIVRIVYIFFYASILMSIIYYVIVGANLYIKSLVSFVSTGSTLEDVASQRLNFYSGENYYAPGFFNLFKNYLVPASFFSILLFHVKKYKRRSKIFIGCSFILYLLLIMGTGQRGAMILSLIFGFIIAYYFLGRKQSVKVFTVIGSVFFVIFTISTFFLARGPVAQISSFNDFIVVSQSAIDRFLVINQTAGLNGFKYIEAKEHIQWGYDWIAGLEQFLPGKSSHVSLANKVFKELYGSYRGTTPPTMMVSVYYNFGVVGVFLFPMIFVFGLNRCYILFLTRYKSYMDLFLYLFLYFSLVTWVISGIDYPLRNGLLLFLLLLLLRKIFKF